MKKYMQKHWFEYVYSALLTCIAAVGISLMFGYILETNDDAFLRSIVSGNYTGEPEAHLIYIMYPLGFILKSLYSILPKVYWYDFYMIGMHYICIFMLLVRVGEQFQIRSNKFLGITASFIGLMLLDLPYIVMHQYTVLAGVMMSVAVFWMATAKETGNGKYWYDRVVIIVFSILCLWTRKQVFLLAVPLLALITIVRIIKIRKDKKAIKNKLLFGAIFSIVVLGSFVTDKVAYSDSEWKDFLVYNEARTDLYDFYGVPSFDYYQDRYEKLGLDYGDWIVMQNYNTKLASDLSLDNVVELADLSEQKWVEGFQYTNMLHKMIYIVVNNMYTNPVQPIGLLLTVLYVLALINCYKKDKRISFLSVCAMLLFEAAVVGYFVWQGRFLERISYGFYLMQTVYLFGILLYDIKEVKIFTKKNVFWCVVGSALVVLFCGTVGLQRVRTTLDNQAYIEQNCSAWETLNQYFREYNEVSYCIDTTSFAYFTDWMFCDEMTETNNVIRLGTWTMYSPLDKKHDGENDLLSLLESGQCYYVQDTRKGQDWIHSFWESKGYDIEIEVVDTITIHNGCVFEIIDMSNIKKVKK